MKPIVIFIKKEIVLVLSFVLAAVSAILVPIDGDYLAYIDFRTLAILFCLMAIMAGLQKLNIFRQVGEIMISRVHTIRAIALIFIMLCFILSMFITNDVALITFVPFTIIVFSMADRMDMLIITIVLETVAANLGSMLLPMGNPQNIYLYSLTHMGFGEFVLPMLPYAGLSLVMIVVLIFVFVKNSRKPLHGSKQRGKVCNCVSEAAGEDSCLGNTEVYVEKQPGAAIYDRNNYIRTPFEKVRFYLYLALFILSVLVVIRVVDFRIGFVVVLVAVLAADIKTLPKVDYSLLFTFIFLFIFIGNLKRIPEVSTVLSNIVGGHEVLASVVSSQVISNVPAAILLSGFTDNIKLLIVGTNLGGLGTLIASMASLISFKLYSNMEKSEKGRYFLVFTVINFAMLIVLMGFYIAIG